MWQPLDPLPSGGTGGCRQDDDREVGRTVSDTRLHHQCPRRCPGLWWCAGKTDATLIQQIDQDGSGWQRGQVATIDLAAVDGYPSLIRQADTEHEGVLVGRSSLPEALRQLGSPPDDLGEVEMGAPDGVELSFVGEPQRVDDGFGGRRCDLDAGGAPGAPPTAVAWSPIWVRLRRCLVARPANEIELTERGRQQRIGAILDHSVESEHAMANAQALVFPARRVGGRMAVEIALVGGNTHPVGMLDHDLATGYQHLIERQRRHIGPPSRS